MADTSPTKQVLIKGIAAEQFLKTKGRRGGSRRSTRKLEREEEEYVQRGGDAPPGAPVTNARNYNAASRLVKNAGPIMVQKGGDSERKRAPGGAEARPVQRGGDPPIASTPGHQPQDPTKLVGAFPNQAAPAVKAQIDAGTNPQTIVSAGGIQTGGSKKVILSPKKKTRSKVILAASTSQKPTSPSNKKKAVGQTRKIRVGLSGLKKRLTRAKTISKDSKEKPIEEIRKVLEGAKLVKPASEGKKVPDSVLRDIYKDYLQLRNRAL